MRKLAKDIVAFTDTWFFVYNTQTMVVAEPPTYVDSVSESVTVMSVNDKEIERNTFEQLMDKFNQLGLTLPDDNHNDE